MVTNPWNPTASPEGWHSDGTTHYTTAQGNNVFAYQDLYDDDFFTGITVDGGTTRNFNFPYTRSTCFDKSGCINYQFILCK
ncbi:M36 family metallopeptidase [Chryseobacterium wanjuense]